ncbi:UNVERIFIED_CONTAM: hypothetical protein EX528_19040 [Xanthomonas axonopodis]
MSEVKALRGFEYGGTRKRDEVFDVANKKHLDQLVAKRLVVEVVAMQPSVDGATGGLGGADLVSGNAAETVAKVKDIKDVGVLQNALEAEQGKGETARKTVLEALQAAIIAAQKGEA